MLDFLDQLMQEPSYAQVLPSAAPAPQAQANPAAPSPLDLMAQASAPVGPLPQADLSNLLPLTLLHFAANVSQPRANGQSTMGKVLQSVAGAAAYNMNEKKSMEDRAVEQELQKRKIAATDAQLENAKLGNIKTRQDIQYSQERQPLELSKLKLAIENAKGDNELQGLQIRVARIKEKYAQQEIEAGLAEKAAKTDQERASAMMARSHAALFQRQSDELLTLAQLRSADRNRPDYLIKEGLQGDPPTILDKRTGQTYMGRLHSPADASAWAERQVEALNKVEKFPNDVARKQAFDKFYNLALRGNVPAGGVGASTEAIKDAAVPATVASPGTGMTDEYRKALMQSGQSPDNIIAFEDPVTKKVTVMKGGNVDRIFPTIEAYRAAGGKVGKEPRGMAPAAGGADPMVAQYQREQKEMDEGTRADFSPEVKAWIGPSRLPVMNEAELARRNALLDRQRRGM